MNSFQFNTRKANYLLIYIILFIYIIRIISKKVHLLGASCTIPYLHRPIGTTRDEDTRMIVIPGDPIDGHVVRIIRVKERTRVGLGTDVQLALLRPHQEQVILLRVEVE